MEVQSPIFSEPNVIISMEDPKDIKELIKQIIKVDNRIYQSKRAKRELGRLL